MTRGRVGRDEQVFAEKWVSRNGVSAGEYHIATLRRGLRRALRASRGGMYAGVHADAHPRVCACKGRRGATV